MVCEFCGSVNSTNLVRTKSSRVTIGVCDDCCRTNKVESVYWNRYLSADGNQYLIELSRLRIRELEKRIKLPLEGDDE